MITIKIQFKDIQTYHYFYRKETKYLKIDKEKGLEILSYAEEKATGFIFEPDEWVEMKTCGHIYI